MTYKVVLVQTEEGYSVSVPSLPGCASQGETEAQAIENIQHAIQGYLQVVRDPKQQPANFPVDVREVQVA